MPFSGTSGKICNVTRRSLRDLHRGKVAAVGCLLLVGACSNGRSVATHQTIGSTTPTPRLSATAPSVSPAAARAYLARLAPRGALLGAYVPEEAPSFSLRFVSLDFCNRSWQSDRERIAQRYEAFAIRAQRTEFLQTLDYFRPGGAQRAFAEWSRALKTCHRFHGTGQARGVTLTARAVPTGRLPFRVDGIREVEVDGAGIVGVIVVGYLGDVTFVCQGDSPTGVRSAATSAGKCLGFTAALAHAR